MVLLELYLAGLCRDDQGCHRWSLEHQESCLGGLCRELDRRWDLFLEPYLGDLFQEWDLLLWSCLEALLAGPCLGDLVWYRPW
jgi:hypothetical protein